MDGFGEKGEMIEVVRTSKRRWKIRAMSRRMRNGGLQNADGAKNVDKATPVGPQRCVQLRIHELGKQHSNWWSLAQLLERVVENSRFCKIHPRVIAGRCLAQKVWNCYTGGVTGQTIEVLEQQMSIGVNWEFCCFFKGKNSSAKNSFLKNKTPSTDAPPQHWLCGRDVVVRYCNMGQPVFSVWKSGSRSTEHKLVSFGHFCPKIESIFGFNRRWCWVNSAKRSTHAPLLDPARPNSSTLGYTYPWQHLIQDQSQPTADYKRPCIRNVLFCWMLPKKACWQSQPLHVWY